MALALSAALRRMTKTAEAAAAQARARHLAACGRRSLALSSQARLAALEAELRRRQKPAPPVAPSPPAPAPAPTPAPAPVLAPAPAQTAAKPAEASPPPEAGWEALLAAGNAAHGAGDSRRAEELYSEALQQLPTGALRRAGGRVCNAHAPAGAARRALLGEAARLYANRGAARLRLREWAGP